MSKRIPWILQEPKQKKDGKYIGRIVVTPPGGGERLMATFYRQDLAQLVMQLIYNEEYGPLFLRLEGRIRQQRATISSLQGHLRERNIYRDRWHSGREALLREQLSSANGVVQSWVERAHTLERENVALKATVARLEKEMSK